jgi:hypothetical protein
VLPTSWNDNRKTQKLSKLQDLFCTALIICRNVDSVQSCNSTHFILYNVIQNPHKSNKYQHIWKDSVWAQFLRLILARKIRQKLATLGYIRKELREAIFDPHTYQTLEMTNYRQNLQLALMAHGLCVFYDYPHLKLCAMRHSAESVWWKKPQKNFTRKTGHFGILKHCKVHFVSPF